MEKEKNVSSIKIPGDIKVLQNKISETPKPSFNSRWRILGTIPKKDK